MTEKPVKPLSERIREARVRVLSLQSNCRGEGAWRAYRNHAETLGFLAELAEMMEKNHD